MEQTAVELSGLTVRFGGREILSDIRLRVPAGEIVGLLGPSGAGKTTLVRAVMGMVTPAAGQIEVFGQRIPSLRAVRSTGYMAQSDALYEDLSATENLVFFGALFGMARRNALQRAVELLRLVDLGAEGRKPVRAFSGGMKRRLSLAIALIHNPSLLLLDEPTVGIDPLLRRRFWDEFSRQKAAGRAILMTTHVMDEAERCDRVLMLRGGAIIADGSVPQLLERAGAKTLEEAFLHFSAPAEGGMAS